MFGDYELAGEIHARPDVTVYRARRRGRDYVIKVCCPLKSPEDVPPADSPRRTLGVDPKLQFLNAVKLQEEAINAGSRRFAPIYDGGSTPDGRAWYATAFYARGSLRRWVASGMEVEEASLRWVVNNVLRGLLDLKRATGRSHGNLKLTNILMGKAVGTPLEETPLFLADPLADLKTWSGSLELRDLRALGELIFQLVTRRVVEQPEDFSYPVEPSVEWNRLGEKGGYWRELCNRLLEPELSLQDMTLLRLAAELRATSGRNQLPKVLALVLIALMAGGGYWYYQQNQNQKQAQIQETIIPAADAGSPVADRIQVRTPLDPQNMEREYNRYMALAQEAEAAGKYQDAVKHYTAALQWKTNDVRSRERISALRPKARAQQQTAEMFNVALIIARASEQAGSFTNALERYEWALNFDPANTKVKDKIRELEPKAEAQRLATTNLAQALAEAQAAEAAGDYIVASALYQAVEQLNPKHALAKQQIQELAAKAAKQHKEVGRLMAAWQQTTNLITRADRLISERKYAEAAGELDRAIAESQVTLEIDPSPDLQELHNALVNKAQGVREFEREMKLGQYAFEQQSYAEAQQHFSRALELIPGEERALLMLEEINQLLEAKQP